ncbi:MAG: hypothetical protein OSB75_01720 [Dehalococcoidia bacterium]|nr:hypothetical protein [Dehalococcoidia bacterium]
MNSKSQSVIFPKATFWMGSRMILDNPGVSSSNLGPTRTAQGDGSRGDAHSTLRQSFVVDDA